MSDTPNEIKHLPIRQQNTNKSLYAVSDLLGKCPPDKYDIIAIQEPYIDFLGNARASPHWFSIYPKTHYINKEKRTRSMILISKKIATDTWTALDIRSPDITVVKIKTHNGVVLIFNLYCDCTHNDSLLKLKEYIQQEAAQTTQNEQNTSMI